MESLIGMTIGGCRIESKIGEGGMGAVYKAHHCALDIPVAVKILHPIAGMANAEERFLREARIAARLRHPHIIGVLNVGYEQNVHFIVMEYVEGKNLSALIKERGVIGVADAARYAMEIAGALDIALTNGIVHRDIKPENILIDKTDKAKLADLGLARITGDAALTQSSTVLGSPFYVAPEQAENPSAVDIRADIYSLGCTLYHMLTGIAPYQGSTSVEIILKHIKDPVPKACAVNAAIPAELSGVVAKMMSKKPEERYQSPSEVIAELKKIPIGREGSDSQRTEKPKTTAMAGKQNNRSMVVTVIAVVCVLIIIGAAWVLVRNASESADESAAGRDSAVAVAGNVSAAVPADSQKISKTEDSAAAKPLTRKPVTATRKPQQVKKEVPEVVAQTREPALSKGEKEVLSAVKIGDAQGLKQLLDNGISPDVKEGSPTTPLHEAVRRELTDAVRILLDKGANPNVRDSRGDTPLHYALKSNSTFIVKQLLARGANPNMTDHSGKTPLEIGANIDTELEQILKQHGAHP